MKTVISHMRSHRSIGSTRSTVTDGTSGVRTRRPTLIRRIIALVVMALLSGVAALVLSTPAQSAEDTANYSFYKLSSSLAAFFSNAQSPDENAAPIDPAVWGSVLNEPGSAGSMLGYVDPDFSFSMEFLNSQISGSSSAVGYDTLTSSTNGGGGGDTATPGMLDYAHFGATLNAMGLDSMGTGLSLGFVEPVAGGLMLLLYIFTGVVDLLFVGIISTLKALNPFTLFYEGVKLVSPTFAEGMTGGQAPPGFLGGLSAWIGQWYQVLNNMAWTVLVPLFIGVLLLSLLLFKNMNRGSAIKKMVIRVTFIGLGLPLIGSMYTGVLNSMGDASESGSAGSTQVVLSTYVDFQSWAFKNRLYVPEGAVIEWEAGKNKPTAAALANVRNTALEINKATNPSWATIASSLNVGQDKSWTDAALNDSESNSGGLNGYMSTIDLLGRYMSGSKIDAASYETAIKGDISTSRPYTNGSDGKQQVSEWFIDFSDPKKGLPEIEDPGKVSGNPVMSVAAGTGLQSSNPGATFGTKKFTSPSQWGCQSWVSTGDGGPLNCNMSTLSMYNYLNTSFGEDSMTMYSSNKSTSGATREMHNSVTQVGTGVMSGLYWLNAMVLLGSFVIIGLGYALAMLFSNIRRGFQLITAIPFATVGAVPGIAKVIIYATAMILEVIVTLFIYRFIQVFLISIPQIVEMPFSAVLNGVAPGDTAAINLLSGGTVSMVMTVLSIIALIAFTVLALRVRKTLVKSINEVVTKLIDKFMDTNIAPPGGKGGMMPALAGGLASGAGMAAASKAMGGGTIGGGARKPGGPGAGPGGIQAGGIPTVGGPGSGPGADGAPAGSLTVGGGTDMDISGEAGGPGSGGPDGSGGDPGRNGQSGGPLALGAGSSTSGALGMRGAAADDQSVAKAVQAQGGLSEPGSKGSGDVLDTMAGSINKTQSQYGAKDRALAEGAVAGGKAVTKGAEAAGRGMAGDAVGAAAAGTDALGHAKKVQGSAQQAQAIQKEINAPAASTSAKGAGKTLGAGASKAAPAAAGRRAAATGTQAPRPSQAAPGKAAPGKAAPAPSSGRRAAAQARQGTPAAPVSRPAQVPVRQQAPGASRVASRPQQAAPRQAPATVTPVSKSTPSQRPRGNQPAASIPKPKLRRPGKDGDA